MSIQMKMENYINGSPQNYGHDLTLSVNKVEVKYILNQVHDALIVDGKVQMFFVNERGVVKLRILFFKE